MKCTNNVSNSFIFMKSKNKLKKKSKTNYLMEHKFGDHSKNK
jgi:hypothetical protein